MPPIRVTLTILPFVLIFQANSQSRLPIFEGKVEDPEDETLIESWNEVDSFDAVVKPFVEGSSALDSTNGLSYLPRNAYDWNFNTAWVPKSSKFGVGEWLQYSYSKAPLQRMALTSLVIFNGYRKSRALWKANCRIKELKMYLNGRPYAIIHLRDAYNFQTVKIGLISLNAPSTVLRFVIQSVYKGTKYKDVALTELEVDGVGAY
jgi:hypothetical protein